MVQICSLFPIFASISISLAASASHITSAVSYSPDELSSASSRALKSDATFIFEFLGDFVSHTLTYLDYMQENSMTFPGDLQNYIFRLQSITNDQSIIAALETRSFPFEDFITMYTKFDWASSFMSANGVSTIYKPEDFLTVSGEASSTSSSDTSSATSEDSYSGSDSGSKGIASSTDDSKSASSTSAASSSDGSKSSTSSSESSSSTSTVSDSSNGVGSLYIPIISLPVAMISVFLL